MERPSAYIPIDRRHALATGVSLPARTQGAALFADISGFTPLTEALALELGPKRGAEELPIHLNRVYDALITQLHRYGGSVIGFAGDAITCWLDGDDGHRATACALGMQQAMAQFAEITTVSGRVVSLGLKVAVAIGSVRRFAVGDPGYVIVDTMTGTTLEDLAAAEHQAERGDVILQEAAAQALAGDLQIGEWRTDADSGQRFAVVTGLSGQVPESPWPALPDGALSDQVLEAWSLPPVYERMLSGQGEFLAELRPAVALFLRFGGINFEQDEDAPEKLDAFIRGVQQILIRYDGSLIQLTIGDKGSYLYAAFGAPIAHEDDAARAGSTALALQELGRELDFIDPLQIGITQGRMRTGAYGSSTRRTYGVLGDAVNLSARLMSAAQPGQILVSDLARHAAGDGFTWESLPNIRVKGKSEPITLWRLVEHRQRQRVKLQEPHYRLPMVGRAEELTLLSEKLDQVLLGRGQVVGLTAEAGMGKSRLAAEVIRLAGVRQLVGLGGECQSYGTQSSYLVWQNVWRGFFDLEASQSLPEQIDAVEQVLRTIDPALVPRLPLLGPVLNLSIPDNDLTAPLEAKVRKASLEALLVTCLQARARQQPLLIVLEDCHWLDPLSHELIGIIGRAIAQLPVFLLLIYRPPDRQRLQAPPVDSLPYFTEIALADFTAEEAEQLISLKLRQFLGEGSATPPAFVAEISRQAAGNPFYIEELINYLQDLGVDPHDQGALQGIDLPTSVYSLVLSRIDQLDQQQQITIRVASVIGRLFKAAMVWGVYPELAALPAIETNLQVLSDLELTPMDTPDPEMTYLFRHIITQEVAYESLLYATRRRLHEQIGLFMEQSYARSLDRYVPLLAYHFEHSDNQAKKREYLLKAGIKAQAEYANVGALEYYGKVLPLVADEERSDVLCRQGRVLELIGRWVDAEEHYRLAMEAALAVGDHGAAAWAEAAWGEVARKRGRYDEALDHQQRARMAFEALGDLAGVGQTLHYAGTVAGQKGDFALARALYHESMAIRERLGDRANLGSLLSNLGIVARINGEFEEAERLHEQGLAVRREVGDRWAIANSLTNLGGVFISTNETTRARPYLEEALLLQREIGDPSQVALVLNNLGGVARREGKYEVALGYYKESLEIWRSLGETNVVANTLNGLCLVAVEQNQHQRALQLAAASLSLRQQTGAPLPARDREQLDALLQPARLALSDSEQAEAWNMGQAWSLDEAIAAALA